jgi:three-Cys-motif partner protein
MKAKRWTALNYIDLFAGAGIERVEGRGLDWGSPLIAAQAPTRFHRLFLCEMNRKPYDALVKRLGQPNPPLVMRADSNVAVNEIVEQIPQGSLSLAFLDPHGLHLHFNTLKRLSTRRVDFLIFFPDHLDALRNWEAVYQEDPNSNLDLVLDTKIWREKLRSSPQQKWADVLTQLYVQQVRSLGYSFFDYERISMPGGRHLYKLIFCSRDKAGGTIWRRIALKRPDGQTSFDFGGS